jgi:hypothetical protein
VCVYIFATTKEVATNLIKLIIKRLGNNMIDRPISSGTYMVVEWGGNQREHIHGTFIHQNKNDVLVE